MTLLLNGEMRFLVLQPLESGTCENRTFQLEQLCFLYYSSTLSKAFSVLPSAVIHDVNPFALA